MAKLVSVDVRRLLGQFNHVIKFPADWDFAIVHGPNGVGKTKLLELIEATVKQQFRRIDAIPFKKATLTFDDGTTLEVSKGDADNNLGDAQTGTSARSSSEFILTRPGEDSIRWNSAARPRPLTRMALSRLEHFLPSSIARVGADRWIDHRAGLVMTTEEILDRYSDFLPQYDRDELERVRPVEAVEFLNQTSVYLIETQRLLNSPDDRRRDHRTPQDEDRKPTVKRYADRLAAELRDAMTENSRISQKLDSSFPRRVLEDVQSGNAVTEEEIRARYIEQNELREQLSEIAVLDAAPEVPLPERRLEDWERIFLWKYLEDADQKLASFKDLLVRARLFREIVNSRFLFKKMRIDRIHGFRFIITSSGEEIDATDLSSGEQHEVVLTYGLLFMVQPGSLVLIDEPEISLHVSWQQNFVNDIRQISDIADLRFLVATHSPQVIHHWIDRTITLAPEVAG